MKLLIVVVSDHDAKHVLDKLVDSNYQLTKLASQGGFLKQGSTTFFTGINDDQLDDIVQVLKDNCSLRTEMITTIGVAGEIPLVSSMPIEVSVGGAAIFVLPLDQIIKI